MRIDMTYFPMFVSIEGKQCLVVGGGAVAARKCRGLLTFGAEVTVISDRFMESKSLHNMNPIKKEGLHNECLKKESSLHKIERCFEDSDIVLKDWALVVAATDDRFVNARVAALCHERQIPVNVADCKEECTFFFPAYCAKEPVAVGVTTSGTSPRLAAALRRRIEAALPGWIGEIRKEIDKNA